MSLGTFATTALAGFDNLIKDVFPSGTMSNSTAAAVVKEQSAGHFMGGSVMLRTPANPKLNLVQARAPTCKISGLPCAAQVEALGGAVSLVSGKELMRYLKTLPASAATYAAMMAIKTLCPQCQDLLEYLDAKADWLNKFNFDGCEGIQKLMDPVFPRDNAKSQALRQSSMVLTGGGKDMADYQRKSKSDTGDATVGVKELESQLGENYNLVWKALAKKAPNSRGGTELKELLMSISGTIIGTKGTDRKPQVQHLKSLVNRDLIEQVIGANGVDSSKVRLYSCDEGTNCLKPKAKERNVRKGSFLFQRIRKLIASITDKIIKNSGEFTADEASLIALSSEQLILKIEIDLARYADKNNVIANQTEYIEALSYEVVTKYLEILLVEVQEAVGELSHAQIADSKKFETFERETRETMRMLSRARIEAIGRYDVILKSKERLRRDVTFFESGFESFLSNKGN
jgi:hypothetical protein